MTDIPKDVQDTGTKMAGEYLSWLNAGNSTGELSEHAVAAMADTIARAILADRKSRAEVAALFIHNRLYKPDFPVCSYHSRDIHQAVMECTQEDIEASRPQPWAPLIPLDEEGQPHD